MGKMNNNRVYKTIYKPEFCEMLIKHSEEGGNFMEFAAKVNVSLCSVIKWTKKYPEFKKAKEIAELKYKAYWKDLYRNHKQRKFHYWEFLFVMVNAFGYQNPNRPPKEKESTKK